MNNTYNLSEKDSSQYEDGYAIFLKRSDFRDKVISKFSSLAKDSFSNSKTISVLDVGCGNGQMTLRYINELKKLGLGIELTLLEPAKDSLLEAKELLRTSVHSINTAESISNHNHDLIISSYVFYHLPAEGLTQLADHLKPQGILAIMMGTNEHPLKSHPGLKSASAHGSSDKLTPFLNVLEKSEKFKISRNKFETSLSLQGLWPDKKLSEEANKLLSFSLNRNMNELKDESYIAINEIFESAFTNSDGFLKPVHEIIWVERLR